MLTNIELNEEAPYSQELSSGQVAFLHISTQLLVMRCAGVVCLCTQTGKCLQMLTTVKMLPSDLAQTLAFKSHATLSQTAQVAAIIEIKQSAVVFWLDCCN